MYFGNQSSSPDLAITRPDDQPYWNAGASSPASRPLADEAGGRRVAALGALGWQLAGLVALAESKRPTTAIVFSFFMTRAMHRRPRSCEVTRLNPALPGLANLANLASWAPNAASNHRTLRTCFRAPSPFPDSIMASGLEHHAIYLLFRRCLEPTCPIIVDSAAYRGHFLRPALAASARAPHPPRRSTPPHKFCQGPFDCPRSIFPCHRLPGFDGPASPVTDAFPPSPSS